MAVSVRRDEEVRVAACQFPPPPRSLPGDVAMWRRVTRTTAAWRCMEGLEREKVYKQKWSSACRLGGAGAWYTVASGVQRRSSEATS